MRRLVSLVAGLALATLAGCSAIVSGDGRIRCERGAGADPCPDGLTCSAEGLCVGGDACQVDRDHDSFNACTPEGLTLDCNDANPQIFPNAPEQCNGNDDNCNLTIDEEQQDLDGDGYTRCGSPPSVPPDCDEEDPVRNPGAAEVCDNVDNDCDGLIDEDPDGVGLCGASAFCVVGRGCVEPGCTASSCAMGSTCDTSVSPATCVNSGGCGDGSCGAGQFCDRTSGLCVDQGAAGDPCVANADCKSRVCADRAALGLAGASSGAGRICMQACCSDANCPADQICWDGGHGARSCLPAALVGVSAVGVGAPTASCSAGSDCRSGVCTENASLCAATCGTDATCGGGLTCAPVEITVTGRPDHTQLTCTGTERGREGEACASGADCAVGICFDLGIFGSACSGACMTGSDCELLGTKCGTFDAGGDGAGWTTVCRGKQTLGSRAQGESCGSDRECDQERCVGGRCADLCCNPEQCNGSGVCAPVFGGSHWEMRCVPAAG